MCMSSTGHTYIHTQTLRFGWLPFRILRLTLIFKWLLPLPQDFQSISGYVLRWGEIAREAKAVRRQAETACMCMYVLRMGRDGRESAMEKMMSMIIEDEDRWRAEDKLRKVEATPKYQRKKEMRRYWEWQAKTKRIHVCLDSCPRLWLHSDTDDKPLLKHFVLLSLKLSGCSRCGSTV